MAQPVQKPTRTAARPHHIVWFSIAIILTIALTVFTIRYNLQLAEGDAQANVFNTIRSEFNKLSNQPSLPR